MRLYTEVCTTTMIFNILFIDKKYDKLHKKHVAYLIGRIKE